GLDRADDLRLPRIRLRVEHVRARGPDAEHDQVTALEWMVVPMPLVAQRARAGIPSEVVQLIACGGKLRPSDDLAVAGRLDVAVDDGHGVALRARRIVGRNVGE